MNIADQLILRESARVSYAHAATFICTETGVVLDTNEARYGASLALAGGDSLYCPYCGSFVTYLKYWPDGKRMAEHR